MSDSLDALVGVVPVVIVAGVATKMTDKLFDEKPKRYVSKRAKRKNNNYVKKARKLLGA